MEPIARLVGSRRPVDLLVWVAVTVPVFLADETVAPGSVLSLRAFEIVGVLLLAFAVLLSRRLPALAAALPALFAVVVTGDIYTEQLAVAQIVLAFLLGRRTVGGRAVLQLFAVLGAVGLMFALVNLDGPGEDWFTFASTAVFQIALPWTAGQYALQHAELLRAGWELAERREREQDLAANQVRLRERARIARDMHDSLGHELSLIAVRAAALQVAAGMSDEGRAAAGQLRQAAASATDRLRDIIGMLRDYDDAAPMVPNRDSMQSLVQQADDSGVLVTLDDTTADLGPPVPEATARAAYRVVQEALTNATKHAPGAAVAVTLRRDHQADDPALVVSVVNDAPTVPPRSDRTQGYGIVGLDESVRLVGGSLDAHPNDGGFTVSARLPLTPVTTTGKPVAAPTSGHALAAARRRVRRSMISTLWIPAAMAAVLIMIYVLNSGRL